ncbi:MAG TPA: TIGR02391 family protein [Gemmatimonadales bacterium]|jgi:hypothetical protein
MSGDDKTAGNRPDAPTEIEYAGIEYAGVAGSSEDCKEAVIRRIQYGEKIHQARIVSADNTHCLLLANGIGDLTAIKSGFASGYGGEGPAALSYVLQLLEAHGVELEEVEVSPALIERLDDSALTVGDVELINSARPVRRRWHHYILDDDQRSTKLGRVWREFRPVIPYAIIDDRLTDLVLAFWDDPDAKLVTGYRRLEDLVREQTGLTAYGSQLMAAAFLGDRSAMCWDGVSENEQRGRGNLFTGAFMAHRNPRAHQELKADADAQLRELLLLNHLYVLEREATLRAVA